jgi:hypothetical protein
VCERDFVLTVHCDDVRPVPGCARCGSAHLIVMKSEPVWIEKPEMEL